MLQGTQVIHYRDHEKALQRWYPMERYHFLKREGLVPTFEPPGWVDTAPAEYSAPEQDPA